MAVKYILARCACVFLLAALTRSKSAPQTRTWLLISAIFWAGELLAVQSGLIVR
jgi:hypothetical protein